jgi:hypothetical protein
MSRSLQGNNGLIAQSCIALTDKKSKEIKFYNGALPE